ncbi:Transcription factor bHLH126 [Linum perenne]
MSPYDHRASQQPGDHAYVDPEDDLLTWAAAVAANDYIYPPPVVGPSGGRALQMGQTLGSIADNPGGGDGGGNEDKKKNRKEIERQRRHQIPKITEFVFQFVKKNGKKSKSDQMGEAANYIRHLKSNVQQLTNRRDNLLKGRALSSNPSSTSSSGTSSGHNTTSSVAVRQRFEGVEVVLSSGKKRQNDVVVLSRVMEAVVEEGFDVTSCVATQIDGCFYITMQLCQASASTTNIDLSGLKQKLNDVTSYQS